MNVKALMEENAALKQQIDVLREIKAAQGEEIGKLQSQVEMLQRQRRHEYYNATNSYFKMVKKFHEVFGLEVRDEPIDFSFESEDDHDSLYRLRWALMSEEWQELVLAHEGEDLVAFADAVCDLIYVLCGSAVSYGIPLDQCFAEVQRSNMSKLNKDGSVVRRHDGKILKSDQFTPPDLRSIIYGQPNQSD